MSQLVAIDSEKQAKKGANELLRELRRHVMKIERKKGFMRIPFTGYYGKRMHLEIERDCSGGHDHIWLVSSSGKRLLYLHIDDHFIDSWRTKGGKNLGVRLYEDREANDEPSKNG